MQSAIGAFYGAFIAFITAFLWLGIGQIDKPKTCPPGYDNDFVVVKTIS